MSQFAGCLILEWGWGFLAMVAIGVLIAVGLLVLLIRLVGSPHRMALQDTIIFEKFGVKVTGAVVNVVFVVGAIVIIGYFIYGRYEDFKRTYSVAMDSPSIGVELEKVRDKFQGDTQTTIIIEDPARKFSVMGSYEGVCVQDLFNAICRKYTSQISCSTSWFGRSLTVDLVQAK